MKTIAYTALHYGRDYLGSAIRSVIDHVDEYHVLYTPIGSHGHRADTPCPETRDELFAIAAAVARSKLIWHDGVWAYEGQQRDYIHTLMRGESVILVLDADEIWQPGLAEQVIQQALEHHSARNFRVPIIHYWRSMRRAVLHDPAFPVRAIVSRRNGGDGVISTDKVINHMGYAQRSEIVGYKLLTHGHKNEFRRDVNWFRDVFLENRQHDCHPVGSEYWNPEPVNPLYYMPLWMEDHPYFDLKVIP